MVLWQSANGMRGRKRDGDVKEGGGEQRQRALKRNVSGKKQCSLSSGQWKRAKLVSIKNISNPSIFSVVSVFVLLIQFFKIS